MPATGRAIVFLSDFGYRNEWVGICHAVMNRIAPASPIVDLSHGVPPLGDVALESNDGRLVVGPDNGLLSPAAAALDGVARAVEVTSPDIVMTPISPSFHARDVLAPAAAHLAAGVDLEKLGAAVDPAAGGCSSFVATRQTQLRASAASRPATRSG
jgi:S-adenosylmethionine hydrolase